MNQRTNAEGILKLTSDTFFIINLILIDTNFVDIAKAEKEASKIFWPF